MLFLFPKKTTTLSNPTFPFLRKTWKKVFFRNVLGLIQNDNQRNGGAGGGGGTLVSFTPEDKTIQISKKTRNLQD